MPKKEPAELWFSCLFPNSHFLPLFSASVTSSICSYAVILCLVWLQQPGEVFGFHQCLSVQHLKKQNRREHAFQLLLTVFSLFLFFMRLAFPPCSRLAQFNYSHNRPLWFVDAQIHISPLVKSFSDWTEWCLFNLKLNWSRLNIIIVQ